MLFYLSLIRSLINQFFVLFCTCISVWTQRAFLNQINFLVKHFLQILIHLRHRKQSERLAGTVWHEKHINIAV